MVCAGRQPADDAPRFVQVERSRSSAEWLRRAGSGCHNGVGISFSILWHFSVFSPRGVKCAFGEASAQAHGATLVFRVAWHAATSFLGRRAACKTLARASLGIWLSRHDAQRGLVSFVCRRRGGRRGGVTDRGN